MMEGSLNWQIEYYTDARGKEVVRKEIDSLPKEDRAKIARKLKLLSELGIELGMPSARPVTGHKPLWELRPGANRVLYFAYSGRRFIILHIFRKKWNQTPARHIAIAERRMTEFLEREERQ
jgi:phage-related protein